MRFQIPPHLLRVSEVVGPGFLLLGMVTGASATVAIGVIFTSVGAASWARKDDADQE